MEGSQMNYLSVCSGIEAATVAWHPLGWQAVAYSEIERFPSEVLAHHYPSTPNLGDMTKFKEWSIESNVDVLVGGTPCQSFSVAGLRKGLDDPRGNLMLTYLAIARQYRPRWLVWENVPGVLSSNGGLDFASLLRGMGELGYGFAYRVLDAQYFGVAQRRRRVFVVGYLGDWRAAAAVLFERHSLSGHPQPSRKKGKGIAGYVESSFGQYREDNIGGTSKASGGVLGGGSETFIAQPIPFGVSEKPDVGHCLRSGASKADKHESTTYVAQPIAYNIAPGKGALKDDIHVTDADSTKTLDASGSNPAMHQGGAAILQPMAVGTDLYNGNITGDVAATMGTPGSSINASGPTVMQAMAVRRLTPVECERLQGFADNYTDIKSKGKPTPDGPRYKALGNSMAVPVMAWIGQRIKQVEQLSERDD